MSSKSRSNRTIQRWNDFGGGVQSYTSPLWVKDNEAPFAKNCEIQTPGKLEKLSGYSQVSSATASGSGRVKGLFNFEQENGTQTLMRLQDATLEKYNGSSWAAIGSGASGFASGSTQRAEGVNAYIDDEERMYIAAEHDTQVAYTNGTSTSFVTNIYAKHIETWRYKLYLANVKVSSDSYPQRVLYSPEGSDTFDTDNDFFDDMGTPITAIKAYGKNLYIWGENKMAQYDGYQLDFVPGYFGTPAARSVQIANGRMFFYNRNGVFMFAGAGLPTKISKSVQNWIDAVGDPGNVAGGVDAKDRYFLYIGDVTVGGTAYTDVRLIYDADNNSWMIGDSQPYGVSTIQKSGGSLVPYSGDVDTKKVWQIDNGNSFDGSNISSEWRTAKFDAGMPQESKNFYRIYVVYEPQNRSEYITVKYRTDGDAAWSQIEGTNNNVDLSGTDEIAVTTLELPGKLQYKWIQLQLTHSGSGGGFEVYDVQLEFDLLSRNRYGS